jgi:hypothetical protein
MTPPVAFLVAPDWATPVELSSAWQTDVLEGEDATEQRVSVRESPAETMKYAAKIMRQADAGYLTQLLAQSPTGRFNVPRWFDASKLTANVAIGGTSIACDTTDRRFTVGGFALIWRRATGLYEVRTISGVASGALTTDAATKAWTGNTDVEVLPIAPGWLTLPLTREYDGGVLARVAVACAWDAGPVPTTAATTSVADSVSLVSDYVSGGAISGGGFWLPGSYLVVHAEVRDADGVEIPEAVVTWSIVDTTHFAIQPVGLFGQSVIVRNVSASLSTSTTLTATSGSATVTRSVVA